MPPPRTQRRANHSHPTSAHLSDFDAHMDSDTYTPTLGALNPLPPPPIETPTTPRTNESLNLSVLQRHNPSITAVLSIAPYAVIYTFSPPTQTWEKSGIEGTLFVCQLAPQPPSAPFDRYAVIVLNRRGLDNFELHLTHEDDVEITDSYVILQGRPQPRPAAVGVGDDPDADANSEDKARRVIYGLWIFAEPAPSSTAQMRDVNARLIQDCAVQAEASRRAMEQRAMENERRVQQQRQGDSMSLRGGHAIGPDRADDARSGFGVHGYSDFAQTEGDAWDQREANMASGVRHGVLERERDRQQISGQGYPGFTQQQGGLRNQPAQGQGADVLGDLFRRARLGYKGTA